MGICASNNVAQPVEKANPLNKVDEKGTKDPSIKLEKQVSKQLALAKKRRQVIQDAAASIPEDPRELAKFRENYKPPIFEKSNQVKKMLQSVLSGTHKNGQSGLMEDNFYLFNSLSSSLRETFIMAMEKLELREKGHEIIKQGDNGEYMYIVESGTFDCFVNKRKVTSYKSESLFGELALLYDAPRAASIKMTSADATLWKVSRDVFRTIAALGAMEEGDDMIKQLRAIKILSNVDDMMLKKLSDAMEPIMFSKGDKIIEQGARGDVFYLLKQGKVKCIDNNSDNEDVILKDGSYFGELAILNDKPRQRDVVVVSPKCTCFSLARTEFLAIFGSLKDAMETELGYRVLRAIKQLSSLTDSACKRMAKTLKTRSYKKGEAIITEGEKGDACYIIVSGMVGITVNKAKGKKVAELRTGKFFGEAALLNNKPRAATVTAETDDTKCFVLPKETFDKELASVKAELEALKNQRLNMLKGQEPPKIEDLDRIVLLGTGTFGRVYLVTDKKSQSASKIPWALKTMQKKQIVDFKLQRNIMYEAQMMKECSHPFLLALIATYQDKNNLYMLLEFIIGGELFTLLQKQEKLGFNHARKYAASVLEAFIYLHNKDIIYRDLKPENLLIDLDGYIRVVDFGFAKQVSPSSKTFTLCGTPEYLAPEIVLRKGHNRGVDYWALGILVYEMLTGTTPYVDASGMQDTRVVCSNILRSDLKFPRDVDKKSRSLITKLLCRNPTKRLGCLAGGPSEIKQNIYFEKFDFDKLLKKELKAPWKPKVKNKMDHSNFDPFDDDLDIMEYNGRQSWCEDF